MNEFKIILDENFGTYVTIPEVSRKVWGMKTLTMFISVVY